MTATNNENSVSSNVYDQMVEIKIADPQQFRMIRETLTRIGIANARKRFLWPSTSILNKNGKLYIAHFKTLMALDGQFNGMNQEDQERTRDIAVLLESWGMCEIVRASDRDQAPRNNFFRVLKSSESDSWEIRPKYVVGA